MWKSFFAVLRLTGVPNHRITTRGGFRNSRRRRIVRKRVRSASSFGRINAAVNVKRAIRWRAKHDANAERLVTKTGPSRRFCKVARQGFQSSPILEQCYPGQHDGRSDGRLEQAVIDLPASPDFQATSTNQHFETSGEARTLLTRARGGRPGRSLPAPPRRTSAKPLTFCLLRSCARSCSVQERERRGRISSGPTSGHGSS